MVLETSSIRVTGYSIANSWPPAWYLTRDPKLTRNSEISGRAILCLGRRNRLFYMVFSNGKQDRFAVRIKIGWGNHFPTVVETAFCVLTGQYTDTALEHCCGTKIGSKVNQFASNMHWRPYFTANNVTTDEIGYVCATNLASNPAGVLSRCELVWKKGLYSEEGSAAAVERS